MSLETTVPFYGLQEEICVLGSPVESSGQSLLLTYHDGFGHAQRPYLPPAPPTAVFWNAQYEVIKQLGQGAQGVVYLAKRAGVDGYHTNVALKLFYRQPYWELDRYVEEMRRVAKQAQMISRIQHDNLIGIQNFIAMDETRVLVMEWVDGLDLAQLLSNSSLEQLHQAIDPSIRERLNDVIVTAGEDHGRLKPGIAVDILRGCLAGLSSLHSEGIVHCDLKPANIMVKRTGTKKIIDVDSSCVISDGPFQNRGTPYYMAPELQRGKPVTLAADVASLGYLLIELLTGRRLFRDCQTPDQLLQAKLSLPKRLAQILPIEVRRDGNLCDLASKMVAVEPKDRFADADAVDLDRSGAANYHRSLVKTNLSTDYRRELAWWLELMSGGSI
jgi:eukaryotic-like serine/threonine-protein kinase